METKIVIVQFLFVNKWKVLSDSLGAIPALTSHEFHSAPDVLQFCANEQNCLVITNVASKEDLIQLATFVKSARRALKNTVLKIVVVNATENKQFEKAIAKLGSVEILEPTVSVKALRFKMDFWMKAMRGQAKKLGAMNQESIELSANETAPESKTFVQHPPLECESDIWLMTKESDCKRIIGRWMVKLMGPSPYVGVWNEVPNKPNVYTFQFKKAFIEVFANGSGHWFFKGEQKPEFNWQENRWMFTGEEFELFHFDGTTSHSRVKLAGKVLNLAVNSPYAKTKESLIVDSFNKDLVFRQEAELLKGMALDFESEGDLGGNLEGKIKDKQPSGKNQLEGKFKDQEEKKGNLHGKLKEKEEALKGHLEGEVNEQEEAQGNLEGKLKDKEASLKGQLAGKVKEQEEKKGNLEGKVKDKEASLEGHLEGEVKEKEASKEDLKGKQKTQSAEEIESKYKGKVGEVEAIIPLDKTHKQHNEKLANKWGGDVKEYTPEELAERERQKAQGSVKGPGLKGKNDKTEHLDAHWGGKNSSEAVNTKGLSAPGTSDVKEGSLLDLKKTEHEHQTHYKNHNEATQYEAGELGKNQYDNDEGGALGGKSSTDKLASHYGKGKATEYKPGPDKGPLTGRKNIDRPAHEREDEEDTKGELSGKSKTDKIKGHYGSGKKQANELESLQLDIDDVVSELENSIGAKKAGSTNVLPFVKPEEEKAVEQLTESTSMHTYIVQGGRQFECKLDDFFESTLIFVSKNDGLRVSEKAALDISLDYQGKNAKIKCDAMVMSLEDNGAGATYVTVEVKTDDTKAFDAFMDILKSRQENIQSFMMKARGF